MLLQVQQAWGGSVLECLGESTEARATEHSKVKAETQFAMITGVQIS